MLVETVKLAIRAILRNAVRSFLTVLGIVIGVAAVITMVTVGNGATTAITAQLSSLGHNLLFAVPGQRGPGSPTSDSPPFDLKDVEAIERQIAGVLAAAPQSQTSAVVVAGSESRSTRINGTDADFLVTQNWTLAAGRNFAEGELRAGRAVCIIGETVRADLFGRSDPVGQSVRVANISCPIIGMLAAKGQSAMGTDQDDIVLMPIRAYQRRMSGTTAVGAILISAKDGVDTAKVQAQVESLLRERRRIQENEDDDFSVRDMRQVVQTMTSTTTVMTGLLGAVAAVSLLVGGIGIMNIMLVSVTERTREIGIRLAIGARESQVLAQFLIEAMVLSLFGGLIGILIGLTLALASIYALNVPFVIDASIVVVAFVFSALVGIVFGYFPARRAARLDPIEALRHE